MSDAMTISHKNTAKKKDKTGVFDINCDISEY